MKGSARHISLNQFATAGTIDLGHEPPLLVSDEPEAAPIHRTVSVRWLAGAILTGLTSVFLMGGALMAALDNPNHFASLPDGIGVETDENGGDGFGQKSDRMRPTEEEVATRQILKVSTVTRQGERDFIKLRPFARIVATIGTGKEDQKFDIPEYDVLRIFADSTTPDPGAAGPNDGTISETSVDGEVSVKVSPLDVGTPVMNTATLDSTAVEQVVRAAAKFGGGDIKMATAMAYASDADYGGDVGMVEGEDPFSALGVKIVPENVSNVAKSDVETVAGQTLQEKLVTLSGDKELLTVLEENSMTADDATEVVTALAELIDLSGLGSANKVRVAYTADEDDAAAERAIRVSVYENGVHQATVARSDADTFVRADEPGPLPEAVAETDTPVNRAAALPKLYDAVYRTALEQQVPAPLVDQLIRIFAFDVDFQTRITPGDSMEIFHSIQDPDDPDAAEPEILYAALNVGGLDKRFYRFRTPDDGYVDYYDEDGRSAKKFLMRKPVSAGVLRSRFGMRRHPILKSRRMHNGVDYAASYGTPILAAGNGRVEKAGRTSGYGNLIVIKHTNGYETAYAHQSKFAKGIAPGVRVRQGQVIGYVGSTGLSTGPHLHFEIRVNGSPVDPLRIRLPRGRVLEGELLEAFQNERNRIDALLGNQAAPTTVAARQ